MYSTSLLYRQIIAGEHWFETKVAFNSGSSYAEVLRDELIEVSAQYRMFSGDQPSVGGCLAGELSVRLLNPSFAIPRMGLVRPFVRVRNETQTSEWIPQGKFYIDTRETTNNDDGLPILSLHCYDAMLKAEADYPNTTHNWPYLDINVVKEIAKAMGLQTYASSTYGIDSRTITAMNNGYTIGLPAGQTMREVLSHIAAMYGGNWVMSYDGKLLLVKLTDLPPETNLLVTPAGIPFVFEGGDEDVRIIV